MDISLSDRNKLKSAVLAALVGLLLLPFGFDYAKFILFTIGITGLLLYQIFSKEKAFIWIPPIDIPLLAFVGIGLLSAFWARDISLVWGKMAIWLAMLLAVIVIRNEIASNHLIKHYFVKIFLLYFFIVLLLHLYAVQLNLGMEDEWHTLFTRNKNYTTTFLTILYPYLLFYKSRSQFFRFLKIVGGILLLVLIYTTAARGALLALMMLMVYKMITFQSSMKMRYLIGIGGFCVSLWFFDQLRREYPILQGVELASEFSEQYPSRAYLIKSSLELFKDHPLAGIGVGQWQSEVYSEDLSEIDPFNKPNSFVRIKRHNLYTTIAAELGAIGLILFGASFLFIIYIGVKQNDKFDGIEQGAIGTLLAYLMASSIYATANSDTEMFSNIQFMGFISVAILSSSATFIRANLNKKYLWVLVVMSLMCAAWGIANRSYAINWYRATLEKDNKKAIQLLESSYSTFWHTTQGLALLPFELAKRYVKEKDKDQSLKYFEEAYQLSPKNERLLFNYASYLKSENLDLAKAKELALYVYQKQKNHHGVNMLLAEIAAQEGDSTNALKYLENIIAPENALRARMESLKSALQ